LSPEKKTNNLSTEKKIIYKKTTPIKISL